MKVKSLFIYLSLILVFFMSCSNESKVEQEIAKINIDFEIERFDEVLASGNGKNLSNLKIKYPFLFPEEIPDSVWVNRINSDLQQQIFNDVKSKYNDLNDLKSDLKNLFKHLKYYDKAFKVPRVITVADYVDYRTKLVVNDQLVIINLANYLGETHEFYQNIPMYFADKMIASQIIPEIAEKYAERYVFQTQRKTFLEEMIYFGKLHYFKDVIIPNTTEAQRIGYSQQDFDWSLVNEAQIWSHFVEKEMLFSTDAKLFSRFTVPAPFSKFYLEIDNQSPGRIGQYIGWQIVRAYADKTDAKLFSVMRADADEIFNKAKFKPKR